MTTAIVILNWNGRDFLKKYLPCLLQHTADVEGVSVVVADNASDDDSLEMLGRDFPGIQTVVLDRNYGFAGGYNLALKQVKADNYLLLNSDVEVCDDFITPLIEWFQLHPDCGICGPKLHQITDRDRFEYAGAAGGYIDSRGYPFCRGRVMKLIEKDEGQYDTPQDVLWVSGAALMIRSRLFHELGGFCADFFAHMEEIDLCWRARLAGWRVSVVPRSTVYHVGGGTLPSGSARKLFLNHRNNLLMLHRCLPKTFALESLYNYMGRLVMPDEGPDIFHNCSEIYLNDLDHETRDAVIDTCASMAVIKTKHFIFTRMCLDGLSACVYLMKGRPDNFRAVIQAHREYRKMCSDKMEKGLAKYLKSVIGEEDNRARIILTDDVSAPNYKGRFFGIRGMWAKWQVLESISEKDSIFAEINEIL